LKETNEEIESEEKNGKNGKRVTGGKEMEMKREMQMRLRQLRRDQSPIA
jgi:hypothetical protein